MRPDFCGVCAVYTVLWCLAAREKGANFYKELQVNTICVLLLLGQHSMCAAADAKVLFHNCLNCPSCDRPFSSVSDCRSYSQEWCSSYVLK